MKKTALIFSALLILASFAGADVYVKTKTHSDPMMGGPARDSISEQWLGAYQVAMIFGNLSSVLDFRKGIITVIAHKTKSYVEASFPFNFSKLFSPEMSAMRQGGNTSTTVKPTGIKKNVGQWPCDEYEAATIITTPMGNMTLKKKIYATENVPFDADSYAANLLPVRLQFIPGTDRAFIREMMKIKGFWILDEIVVEVMGKRTKTISEVVEISEKAAPSGIYDVPAGYTKKDRFDMKDMRP
jgi:hypothetical protein